MWKGAESWGCQMCSVVNLAEMKLLKSLSPHRAALCRGGEGSLLNPLFIDYLEHQLCQTVQLNTFLPFLHFISCSHARVGCFALGLLLLFRALHCASLSSILHAALHLSDFLCPLHLPHSSPQTEVIKQNLSPHVLLQQSPQSRYDWWLLYIPGVV